MTYTLLTTPGGHGYLDGASTMPALVEGLHAVALQNDTVTGALQWWKGATGLPAGTDLETLVTGTYSVWSASNATSMGLPTASLGTLQNMRFGSSGGVQVWYGLGASLPELWARVRTGNGWAAWTRFPNMAQVQAIVDASGTSGGSRSAAGFRTVPLAVTLGRGATSAPTSGGYRIPLEWNAPITRWRLHMSTRNPRYGTSLGPADITGVWIGPHDGAGAFTSAPTQITSARTLDGDGVEFVTGWRNEPIGGGAPMLLAYGYTAASAPSLLTGGGWQVTDPATADDLDPTRTPASGAAFDLWIEAETYARTPVVAVVGDSLSAGLAATWPVHDSPLSAWARANSALPVHYAHSGDTMNASTDPASYKWTRWSDLDRPDTVLFALGANDAFDGADLTTLQTRHATLHDVVAQVASPVMYDTQLLPRTGTPDGSEEDTRREYNTWLASKRDLARDYFPWVSAVSADDETLDAEYDVDGTHLNTAGYAALAAAITRPIAAPAL